MRRVKLMVALMVLVMAPAAFSAEEAAKDKPPLIQMAILLDNSGSMSGLINQARTELWRVVNEFATTKKNGRAPELQVALYIYGNPPPQQLLALTNDLDMVSEKLFAVQINGGSEYCGQVISEAVKNLKWSESNEDLKVIFIAGNEEFTQGPVRYSDACKAAIAKGIMVNTIHCGSEAQGIEGKWQDGALLADGKFMNIDQNQAVAHVAAPQDKEIAQLGADLNGTYVPYGAAGQEAQQRQAAQDANALRAGSGSFGNRVASKASVHYRNAGWDLVDAVKDSKVKLEDVKKEDLPENMQKMTPEERKAYVEQQTQKRTELQKKVQELTAARDKYVAEEMKKQGADADKTLGGAMLKAVREQAAERKFEKK